MLQTAPLSRNFISGAVKVRELIDQRRRHDALPADRDAARRAQWPPTRRSAAGASPACPRARWSSSTSRARSDPTSRPSSAGCSGARRWSSSSTCPSRRCCSSTRTRWSSSARGSRVARGAARATRPTLDLVLEIHESALAQTDSISRLRDRLLEINVGLAYDDFGAGQARLFELADVAAPLPEVRPPLRHRTRQGARLAPAPGRLAGGRRARAAGEDPRRGRRERGRGATRACARVSRSRRATTSRGRCRSRKSASGLRPARSSPLLEAELAGAQLPQAVAERGGLLELERLGGLPHLLLEQP